MTEQESAVAYEQALQRLAIKSIKPEPVIVEKTETVKPRPVPKLVRPHLTPEQVQAVLSEYRPHKVTLARLAKKYRCSSKTIWRIVQGTYSIRDRRIKA